MTNRRTQSTRHPRGRDTASGRGGVDVPSWHMPPLVLPGSWSRCRQDATPPSLPRRVPHESHPGCVLGSLCARLTATP